jgi:hypothetical protein
MTLREYKELIDRDQENWSRYLMSFVDDFRRTRNLQLLAEPFTHDDSRIGAILAATAEQLCLENNLPTPQWIQNIQACERPWFVAGMESLKAIALVESPLPFRLRKIFVLENFLARV